MSIALAAGTRPLSSRAKAGHLLPATVVVTSIAILVTLGVVIIGWISDDGYITARYAENLLHGHGPVFNVGESVQGYTHPLWLAVTVPGQAILDEPLLVAVISGGIFTFLTIIVAWHALRQNAASPYPSLAILATLAVVLTSSDSWRSFQTSGLENSLTHLLIAVLVREAGRESPRVGVISLVASLLALNRLDLLVFVAPLMLFTLGIAVQRRQVATLLVACAPLVAWLAFAQIFYGTVIPNTATTKLGMYGIGEGIAAGLIYLADWFLYEPHILIATALSIGIASTGLLKGPERWIAVGAVLYALAVVAGGGDFMRGRMLLPSAFALLLLGSVAAARLCLDRSTIQRYQPATALACTAFLALFLLAPSQGDYTDPRIEESTRFGQDGIANERLFYTGQSLEIYLAGGEPVQHLPGWIPNLAPLQSFSEQCGSFAIRTGRLGALAYTLGPEITVIDIHGLTDRTIAGAPASYLLADSRRGHPRRLLALSYLARRKDITLFSNWSDAVVAGDCGIIAATQAYQDSHQLLNPYDSSSWPLYEPVR